MASALGIPRNYLSRMVRKGVLEKVGCGLHSPGFSGTEHALIEATYQVPRGIVCLLSARKRNADFGLLRRRQKHSREGLLRYGTRGPQLRVRWNELAEAEQNVRTSLKNRRTGL